VPTAAIRREVRSALSRFSYADLDPTVYRHEALAQLGRAIGFDAWCWTLVDPGSGLGAHAVAHNPAVARNPARFHQLTYRDPAALSRADTATPRAAVSLLSQSTGGDLQTSAPWREVLGPAGLGDRLDARLVCGRLCWGHLSLYRGADRGWFTESDRAFIAEVTPTLADQLRRAVRTAAVGDAADDFDEPGTLLLDPHLRVLAITPEAQRWLTEIEPTLANAADPLPGFVFALAARVGATDDGYSRPARVRVCSPSGRWLVVRGAALSSAGSTVPGGSIAVTIEPARSTEIAPLIMQAWGLSSREREVGSLVLDGLDTQEIAAELFISPYTVRDHIRSVFDKVGVRNRRHLVTALATGSSRQSRISATG
jgi:DNA-binding CsgD family transcriptional regulator